VISSSPALVSQNTGFSGSVTLALNLFDGGKKSVSVRNARLNNDIGRLRYDEAKSKLQTDIANAYVTYSNNLQILSLSERSLATAQLNYNRSRELYELGQVNSIQLRDAQLNLSKAETRILEAVYNAKMAELDLLRISGNLYSEN
jgi:outer membrane protein TolC